MYLELSSCQGTPWQSVKSALHPPHQLALDEPTASPHPDVAMRVRAGLLDICANEGTALLVTSHNMLEVGRMCERVVFIAGGHIVADGTPDDVAAMFGHGDLESVFLQLAGTDMELDEP